MSKHSDYRILRNIYWGFFFSHRFSVFQNLILTCFFYAKGALITFKEFFFSWHLLAGVVPSNYTLFVREEWLLLHLSLLLICYVYIRKKKFIYVYSVWMKHIFLVLHFWKVLCWCESYGFSVFYCICLFFI